MLHVRTSEPTPCSGGGTCTHNVVVREATEEVNGLIICAGCGDMVSTDSTKPYDPKDDSYEIICPPLSKSEPTPYDPEIHSNLRKIPYRWCVSRGRNIVVETGKLTECRSTYSDCFFTIKNKLTDLENIIEFSQRDLIKYNEELESSREDLDNKVEVLKGRLGIDNPFWYPEEERQKTIEEIWSERRYAWKYFLNNDALPILFLCVLAGVFMGIGALIHRYFF